MKELLYLEVPTPQTAAVKHWLQTEFSPVVGQVTATADGIRIAMGGRRSESPLPAALSVFVWSLQRTTYLKAFRWADAPFPQEARLIAALKQQLRQAFPSHYPELPPFDPAQEKVHVKTKGKTAKMNKIRCQYGYGNCFKHK
jgi:lycopene cyclase CruA